MCVCGGGGGGRMFWAPSSVSHALRILPHLIVLQHAVR